MIALCHLQESSIPAILIHQEKAGVALRGKAMDAVGEAALVAQPNRRHDPMEHKESPWIQAGIDSAINTNDDKAFENTSTNIAASQMRNALNELADTVSDPKIKKVCPGHLPSHFIHGHPGKLTMQSP